MSHLFYTCKTIYFEPGNIPQNIKESFYLFGSQTTSLKKILSGVWPGSVDLKEKFITALVLSENTRILTDFERLSSLFALSLLYRVLNIAVSSIKLKVDNSNIKPIYKHTTSLALSVVPALFLAYVGYPPEELMINILSSQLLPYIISYFSIQASNFIRSLDLISYETKFSKLSYLSRLLSSSAINIVITLIRRGAELYTDPIKQQDYYHALSYCVEGQTNQITNDPTVEIISFTHRMKPFISITDKLIWYLGRVATDSLILWLHSRSLIIKDIRSPFINAFENIKHEILPVEESPQRRYPTKKERYENKKRKIEEERAQQEKLKENKLTHDSKLTTPTEAPITQPISKAEEPQNEFRNRKEKVKTRPSTPSTSVNNDKSRKTLQPQIEEDIPFEAPAFIKTENYIFYRIIGSQLPHNTWGVLSLKKYCESNDTFERTLSSGHLSNRHSSIKYIPSTHEYEIRPRSTGNRVLGRLNKGIDGFNKIAALGEAMDIYEQCKAAGKGEEPHLIIFNKRVKHSEIGRA